MDSNNRAYFSSSLSLFASKTAARIVGLIAEKHSQNILHEQTNAWLIEIELLQQGLQRFATDNNYIFFEFNRWINQIHTLI